MENKVVLIVGPSGCGKTFVVDKLIEKHPDKLMKAISTTSRPPRANEKEGVDYYFRGPLYFASTVFLEQTVYAGHIYGLTCGEVVNKRKIKPLLAIVDVNGLKQVKKLIGEENVISIFLWAPVEILKRRMENRGDSEEKIFERVQNIFKEHEMDNGRLCDYKFCNNKDNDEIIKNIEDVLKKENILES